MQRYTGRDIVSNYVPIDNTQLIGFVVRYRGGIHPREGRERERPHIGCSLLYMDFLQAKAKRVASTRKLHP